MADFGGIMRRMRPVDLLVLFVVAASVVIATVRFASGVTALTQTIVASAPGELRENLRDDDRFMAWWGGRVVPYREGGDFFGVMAEHPTERSLGNVIGVLAESPRPGDPVMERVIMPLDREALLGREPGGNFTKASGEEYRTSWAPPSRDVRRFSDVEITEVEYRSVLTLEEAAALERRFVYTERTRNILIPSRGARAARTWVLHVREGDTRQYLLVPLESSPAKDLL